jgi:hypothetical protein
MSPRRLVQFMHPGPEHGPDGPGTSSGWKDWNRGDHKRKFLLANGAWTADPKSAPREGMIAFWGEWEPQSECTRLPSSGIPGAPRWLHHPRLDLKAIEAQPGAGWQNTDPLVFGNMFRYAICRQFRANKRRTALSYLSGGDIVLFGSHVDDQFVLDTLLVVDMHADVLPGGALPNWESALHRAITMELVELPPSGVRLYGGQRWMPDAPFSFVPCVTWDDARMPFARPGLQPLGPLKSMITPAMKMGFKVTELDIAPEARAVWDAVVGQVLKQGCCLGTDVREPSWADISPISSHAEQVRSCRPRNC